jgi:hypothetical protein
LGIACGSAAHLGQLLAQPIRWQAEARRTGIRRRVFASHLSDVFDNQAPATWRADFWDLVRDTPDLDWLVLTQRPQLAPVCFPPGGRWAAQRLARRDGREYDRGPPAHSAPPGSARRDSLAQRGAHARASEPAALAGPARLDRGWRRKRGDAREMHPGWARGLRDQCHDAGAAFWMKQTGSTRTSWPGVRHPKGEHLEELPADLRVRSCQADRNFPN